LGFEPTARPNASFVSTLADSVDVMDKTGLDVIVDVGICWVERDIDACIKKLGKRIALVQLSDYVYASGVAPSSGRILPGEGDLPLDRFVRVAVDAGYTGPFEIELMGLEKDCAAPMRKAVEHTNAILNRIL
jgi:sugar phosphate isomerase/epimerase